MYSQSTSGSTQPGEMPAIVCSGDAQQHSFMRHITAISSTRVSVPKASFCLCGMTQSLLDASWNRHTKLVGCQLEQTMITVKDRLIIHRVKVT